jgi:hypothetical protein
VPVVVAGVEVDGVVLGAVVVVVVLGVVGAVVVVVVLGVVGAVVVLGVVGAVVVVLGVVAGADVLGVVARVDEGRVVAGISARGVGAGLGACGVVAGEPATVEPVVLDGDEEVALPSAEVGVGAGASDAELGGGRVDRFCPPPSRTPECASGLVAGGEDPVVSLSVAATANPTTAAATSTSTFSNLIRDPPSCGCRRDPVPARRRGSRGVTSHR